MTDTRHSRPSPPSGVLLIDKNVGFTSHDAVAVARRALNTKKIGHCGTLDPMATGLLMLVIGRATKLQDALMATTKEYTGNITLGVETNSYDAEGDVTATAPYAHLTEAEIRAAFTHFDGKFDQVPPMVSAIKKDGVPLYKLARKGEIIDRPARPVCIYSSTIHGIALPEVEFTIQCSKGFYVRSYAHDIGELLGCGAHLSSLRRTQSGRFHVDGAITAEELKTVSREELYQRIIPMNQLTVE